jgi:hypothetical protein
LAVGHRRFHRRLISNAPPAQKKKIGGRTYDPPNVVDGISDPLHLFFKHHHRWARENARARLVNKPMADAPGLIKNHRDEDQNTTTANCPPASAFFFVPLPFFF